MSGIFTYKNRKIHYLMEGEGEVIVLLHGYLETASVWDSFVHKLSGSYRVIVPDLPGHGKSDMYAEIHSMEFMATIVKDLVEDAGINRIFLTGHSLGGYVTLAFAELFPEMLSGYCLFHSQPFADSPETLEKREREINLAKAGKKDMFCFDDVSRMYATHNNEKFSGAVRRSKQIASSVSEEAIVAVLKGMMARPSRLVVMEEGKVPCLWILGASDNYINCEQIQGKVRLPANAEIVILKNSGHIGFIEEEEESLAILESFMKRSTLLQYRRQE